MEECLRKLEEKGVCYCPDEEVQRRVIEEAEKRGWEVKVEDKVFIRRVK